MVNVLKIQIVLSFFIVTVHAAEAQWGSWSEYGDCFSYEYAVRPRKRRTRTCPDETCIGPSSSYKYNCTPSAIFMRVESLSNQNMGWSAGNVVALQSTMHFRNVHQSVDQPFSVKVNALAMEKNFGTLQARYPLEVSVLKSQTNANLPELRMEENYEISEKGRGIVDRMVRRDVLGRFENDSVFAGYRSAYKFLTTPESSNIYASVVVKVTQQEIGSAYFVHQKIYRKAASTEHDIQVDGQSQHFIKYDFPGSRMTFRVVVIDEEVGGAGYTHHIRLTVFFPPQIDLTRGLQKMYHSQLCRNVFELETDLNKRKLIIKIAEATQNRYRSCNPIISMYHAYDGFVAWNNQVLHKTFIDVTFCKGNDWDCTSMGFNNKTSGPIPGTKSLVESQFDFEGGRRIKEKATGRCWSLNTSTSDVVLTSSCKEAFHFAPVGSGSMNLIHSPSGKVVYGQRGKLLIGDPPPNHKSDNFGLTQKKTLIFNRDHNIYDDPFLTYYSCLTINEDGTIRQLLQQKEPSLDNTCNQVFSFLHAFPQDIMDKISMKSMLKISTSKGPTLFVCTPSKDLKFKSNCRLSTDDGTTWKAMTPKISELKAFIPSEDSFYGLCHSAKYHCKYHVETGLLHYVTLTEYQSKLSDVNMVSVTNLDDMQLDTTPQDGDGASIGVSSLGLYKARSDGAWPRMFLWPNQPEYDVM
ncbi:uncharacterized protein [Clytia hemisphaerica]|uniref:uncharacterized protein n=1 Tax=Clytia hemisphaerica TaxID=252671 RepID=UPI0034D781B0